MLEEEAQHFPRCVRPLRISVGADRAPSRPSVSGSVDIPVLQDSAPIRVAIDSAGVRMTSRYLPTVHPLVRTRGLYRPFENLITVFRMHGSVAIAMKNNGWNRLLVAGNYSVIGPATSSHGDKCGGKINGGPAGKAGMHTDSRVQIRVRCSHDGSGGRSG